MKKTKKVFIDIASEDSQIIFDNIPQLKEIKVQLQNNVPLPAKYSTEQNV